MSPSARRAVLTLGASAALVVGGMAWCAHPVCEPVDDAFVAEAEKYGALADRPDRQWHGRIWQKRNGQWHHCMSWISRKLFM